MFNPSVNINTPTADLVADLQRKEVVTRPLIPLNNSVAHIRRLDLFSTLVIFIGRMLGSGIFATPGLILKDSKGSYSLYFIFWAVAALIAYSGLSLYLELGSYLPVNGATKKFLEYMFPRPAFLMTIVFSVFTLLFSFSSANALVFGEYVRYSLGFSKDEAMDRKIACTLIIVCSLLHAVSKKVGIAVQNVLGGVKILLLGLVLITCFYVLALPWDLTNIPDNADWNDPERYRLPSFDSLSGAVIATALLKCIHSFGGWTSCHTIQNEIKDPINTLRLAGPLSMFSIFALYLLLNLCYLKVIPYADLITSDQLAGALLFSRVYGKELGSFIINLIIALSSATNVMIVIYTDSIMNQEILREGFFPFAKQLCANYGLIDYVKNLFASSEAATSTSGTPLFGILIHCLTSCLVIYIPKRQVYNYIISIQYYPNQLFHAVLCLGLLFKLRKRFPNIHAPIRAKTILIYICLVGSLAVVLLPFVSGNYLFTLASYTVLLLGFLYWLTAIKVVPALGRFTWSVNLKTQGDGLVYKEWDRVYKDAEREQLLA